MESQTEHPQLPCTVKEGGCQTSRKTYLWKDTARNCQLHQIRTISPNQTQGTWLVDHYHQLLLNVAGVYPVSGCKLVLKATQLDNIYLADLTALEMRNIVYGLPQVSIREVDMQRNTTVALEYTAYQLSRQIEAATQTAGARVCKQQHETLDSTPMQI